MHVLRSVCSLPVPLSFRIWLVPGYQCFSETRQLQFVDVAPQCISSEVDIGGLQFETISEALDRFNEQIKRHPLPGKNSGQIVLSG